MQFILPSEFPNRETALSRRNAKNLASNRIIIKFLLMFSQIVGVCTISLSLQRKRLHVIHNAVLLLVFVGLSIYSFSAEKTVDHTKAPNVSIFREIVNRYLYFLLGIMFIAMGYFRANKLISFFKLIFEADRELLKISQFSDEASKKYLIALNVIGFGLCLAILGIALVTEELVLALVHFLFVSVVLATLGPLIGGLQLLRKRFECINSVLSNRAFRNYNNEKMIVTVGDKYRIVATCHDRLCDAAEALNSCYTIQLLGYFTLVFLGTLFAVFGDFRVFFGTEEEQDDGAAILFLRNSYMSVYMVLFSISILTACSTTCDEANETGRLIHKIMNNNGGSVNGVENLRTFSLQLMHRHLCFNACYMFNLDYTLLYTLIGASTTYMVILIQFDLAKPADPAGCNSTA